MVGVESFDVEVEALVGVFVVERFQFEGKCMEPNGLGRVFEKLILDPVSPLGLVYIVVFVRIRSWVPLVDWNSIQGPFI